MDSIRNVRDHLFEGYFLEDLKSVVTRLDRSLIEKNGHCGYVVVQIIMAGIECLGFISSGGKKDELAFNYYYDNYLSKIDDKYKNEYLKKVFRGALRNGTAHYFFTKAGIAIALNEQDIKHLSVVDNTLIIVVSELYDDFLRSYELFKPNWEKFDKGCGAIMSDINRGQSFVDMYIKSLES